MVPCIVLLASGKASHAKWASRSSFASFQMVKVLFSFNLPNLPGVCSVLRDVPPHFSKIPLWGSKLALIDDIGSTTEGPQCQQPVSLHHFALDGAYLSLGGVQWSLPGGGGGLGWWTLTRDPYELRLALKPNTVSFWPGITSSVNLSASTSMLSLKGKHRPSLLPMKSLTDK